LGLIGNAIGIFDKVIFDEVIISLLSLETKMSNLQPHRRKRIESPKIFLVFKLIKHFVFPGN
jgi:hypothetical protein